MTSRAVVTLAALTLVVRVPSLSAQDSTIVGTWSGTSRCVDREHSPACTDEQVIYEVRALGTGGDSVSIRGDKVVNGVRDFMGELQYARAADGTWVAVFQNARVHNRITLRVRDGRLVGELTDVVSGRRVRDIALQRSP